MNVVATNAGVTTTINGGGSLDVINIGNSGAVGAPGLLTPVAGPVVVDGQTGGADLAVDGSGAGVHADYNVTSNTVTRSVPAGFGGVTYSGLTSLLVTVGNGINNVTVPSTSVPTTVNTNGSADVVTIGNGSLDAVIGAVTVIGGPGAPDSLILNDSSDASINNYAITSTSITRVGAGLITYNGTTDAGDVALLFPGPSAQQFTVQTLNSTAFGFTNISVKNVDGFSFDGNGGAGVDSLQVFGTEASGTFGVTPLSPTVGSIAATGLPSIQYSGLGSSGSTIALTSDVFGASNDTLTLTGTTNIDNYSWTPTTINNALLELTSLGVSTRFIMTGVGQASLDASSDSDSVVIATANAIIAPGQTPGTGTIRSKATGVGGDLLPLSYAGIESVSVAGGTAVIQGTDEDDIINVTAAGLVTVTNRFGEVNSVDVSGFNALVINTLNGDDRVTIAPSAFFARGVQVIGGVNGNGSDTLNVSGVDVVVDLGNNLVTGVVGGPISFTGIEHLNATATATITVNGKSGADLLTVTPTGANTATIVPSVGGLLSINTDNPDTLTINTVGGSDMVTVNGTSSNDTIGVARTATAQVTVGALKAIQVPNSESLRIAGGDGNDTFNVTGTGSTAFLVVDGGFNTTNDTLTVTNATAGATTYTPGSSSDSGTITTPDGGIEVLGTELMTLTGAAAGDTLTANGTHGNDTMALQFLGGANRIWLNGQSVISLSSFGTVNLNGRFGDDKFNVLPVGLVGVTTINVNGGDPTYNDSVVISGSNAVENVTVTPASQASATVTGLGATINISTTERMVYDGNDIAALDVVTINGTLTNDTFTCDANSLKGSFRSFASPELDVVHSARIVVNGGGGGMDTVNLLGSAAADTVTSAANAITVNTTGTAAIVTLGAGIDAVTVSTLDGNDNVNLSGISATATVFGGDGNDTIVGSPQVDSIYGGGGNDILVGGAGKDFEYGEEGNDTFGNLTLTPDGVADDAGADQAFGGEGFDNFVWEPGDGTDINNGGGDAADIFRFFGNAAANVFTLRQGGTPTHFNSLIGALVIDNHGIEDVIVDGQGGADTFVVEDLYATEVVSINLNLGAADAAAIDPVTISGRNVADILSVTSSGAGAMSVQGLRYNVNLTNAEATDTLTLNGHDGDDQITVAPGAEAVLTTTLNGINGDDRLTGNVTFMNGGGGNDTLIGGAGNQTMDGGVGDDIFVGNGGTDRKLRY